MQLKKLCTGFLILMSISIFAESNPNLRKKENNNRSADSIQVSINYLKKYIQPADVWQTENPEIIRAVVGLIHFAEDEHIDSILIRLEKIQKKEDFRYITRSPLKVSDSLQVSGYLTQRTIREKTKQLDRAIRNGVDVNAIPLPESLRIQSKNRKMPIAPGDEKSILKLTGIVLPDSLIDVNAIPDSMVNTPNDFHRIRRRDQLRTQILENARIKYNKTIQVLNLDSAIMAYRNYALMLYSDSLQNQLRDSLKNQNIQILTHYNDSIVRSVNDTINRFVERLKHLAQNDSVSFWAQSLSGKPTQIWLKNNRRTINRMYIKNVQNDSIGIQLMNIDKHTLGIAIEDNVTFNRIVQQQRREPVLKGFNPNQRLTQIRKRYQVISPWDLGGNGTFGLTQMYLNNWKAGGRSAFSFLTVLKGYANYSQDKKLKWENSAEFRNGWIRQGGDIDQTQKNDDKLELISRLGINAFKKWYYSAEIDFKTQFFNGYNYPNDSIPISSYMSPATTFFKLGLDYKPNKNFSLFISPLTAKSVFVRDTALIDQTRFGISATSRNFWEPGLNTDIRYKIDINPQISFETKYKMFINYQQPLKKIDVNWENTLVAQLTDRINMTVMLYLLYDDNVTFPTGKMDVNGKEIFKPKLQTKELMTIGFSYKINRHIYKRKRDY